MNNLFTYNFLLICIFMFNLNSSLSPKQLENDDPNDNLNMDSLIIAYKTNFNKIKVFDSTFRIGKDIYHINEKYYFNLKNKFIVPKKYNSFRNRLTKLNCYEAIFEITINKNSKSWIKEIINKEKINKYLGNDFSDLKKHANIVDMSLPKIKNDEFIFDISYSIPVTDIGVGFLLRINSQGQLIYCFK